LDANQPPVLTADFDFLLPEDLIAQKPAKNRDESRLMRLDRRFGKVSHGHFPDLVGFLTAGQVLILNDSRVFPARLRVGNPKTGGRLELLLLEEVACNEWWAMVRPGKRAPIGTLLLVLNHQMVPTSITVTVVHTNKEGHRLLRFDGTPNVLNELNELGEVPLPPYIERFGNSEMETDRERYQTVFAKAAGSVAAPTAGLHFTEDVLEKLRARGVKICFVTLHVGLGTFAPVKAENIFDHQMHEERFQISEETARVVNEAKAEGRRVIAVGTTSLRVLESAAVKTPGAPNKISAGSGRTRIFIFPPYDFKIVDALLTNFHLPRSTLLMLISAFAAPGNTAGREMILSAYREAIAQRYRFFSYGDAMFIS
jgi:S-adenosylmethionine:tRNA ribosyltransferase-isomerase